MPEREIQKVLVANTVHMDLHDYHRMLADQHRSTGLIVFSKGGYGWWVNVGADEEDWAGRTASDLRRAGWSEAFVDLVSLARDLGCIWLVMDRDGPVYDDLPKHSW